MKRYFLCFLTFGLGIAVTSCNKDNKDQLTQKDRDFMTQATYINLGEIDAGNLAMQRATDSAVRNFGSMMINDHTNAQNYLFVTANNYDFTLPSETDQEHKNMAQMLMMLQGDAFDSTYIYMMVEGHDKAIALHEDEAKNGSNMQVKQYAAENLVTIRHHREMADSIARALFP